MKVLTAVSVLGLIGSSTAFAGSAPKPAFVTPIGQPSFEVATCRDARDMKDAGLSVIVTSTGGANVSIQVSEESLRGALILGTVKAKEAMTAALTPVLFTSYLAKGFSLEIHNNDGGNEQGEFPAHISGKVGNEKLDNDLLCRFLAHAE